VFLTAALVRGEESASRPGCLASCKPFDDVSRKRNFTLIGTQNIIPRPNPWPVALLTLLHSTLVLVYFSTLKKEVSASESLADFKRLQGALLQKTDEDSCNKLEPYMEGPCSSKEAS
jgi:hypothetical protein